jgi:hypothetical protein
MVYVIDKCTFAFLDTSCRPGPQWPHQAAGLLLVGAGAGMWIYSAIDAPRAARRANERRRASRTEVKPLVEPPPGGTRGVNLGVTIGY